MSHSDPGIVGELVEIPIEEVTLDGTLSVPDDPQGLVVFAHGSGSSRKSPRNNAVAAQLNDAGHATLLFDLLTEEEDVVRENRFDVSLLVQRLVSATDWVRGEPAVADLPVGYFGASTGAAAALRAAVEADAPVDAVVSRGGRVDLASPVADDVTAACLFIVGGDDPDVLELNRDVYDELGCEKRLEVIEGAGHLFEGPGELDQVAEYAAEWFTEHLG
ncbi:dienelactone hydrolase family protein [Halobaculum sp. D14]|uniref:dienelactone hydrolase family protein n=1 Tax=Halobaculum sp. D14 TaxID=3421642 RepID=UPI003EBEFAD1